MNRRSIITGLVALVAAPSIVRASSLMKISGDRYHIWQWRAPILPPIEGVPWADGVATRAELIRRQYLSQNGRLFEGVWTFFGRTQNIWTDEQIGFYKQEYPA